MADTTTQQQIVREAPEIEAYKLGLLSLAKDVASNPITLPTYQVAGLSPEQQQALMIAQQGVGSYLPYIQQAGAAIQQAGSMYAALPQYAANAVAATTAAAQAATDQSAAALGRAGALTKTASKYGQGAVTAASNAASQANAAAASGVGQARSAIDAGMGYGRTGFDAVQSGAGTANQYASRGIGAAFGMGDEAVDAGFAGARSYDPNSVYDYMNPYQQAATQATLREIGRQGQIMGNDLNAQAVRAGAFGGSRQGVQQAELDRNVLDQMSRTVAADNANNYNQAQNAAMNAFQNQQSRMQQAGNLALGAGQLQSNASTQAGQTALQAGQAVGQAGTNLGQLSMQGGQLAGNLGIQQGQLQLQAGQTAANAGLQAGQLSQSGASTMGSLGNQAAQIGLQAGQQIGQANVSAGQLTQAGAAGIASLGQQTANLGQQASGLTQGDASFMYNMGTQVQGYEQKLLDAQRANELQAQYEPYQRISFISDIYKGAPSSQNTIATSTAPSPSLTSQVSGLGLAGLAAYNLAK